MDVLFIALIIVAAIVVVAIVRAFFPVPSWGVYLPTLAIAVVLAAVIALVVHVFFPLVPFWGAFAIVLGAMAIKGYLRSCRSKSSEDFDYPNSQRDQSGGSAGQDG